MVLSFFDSTLEMISAFTFYPANISPYMWTVLPRIIACFHDWATDFISHLLAPLDNYISKGNDIFCSTAEYIVPVLTICKSLIEDKEREDEDAKYAAKILETLLAHSKGKIDQYLPQIVQLVGCQLLEAKNLQLKLLFCDVLAGAAFYNPALFLETVKQGGPDFEQKMFNYWLSHLPEMKKVQKHMKMSVLGLASLTMIPQSMLPAQLAKAFPTILNQIAVVLKELKVLADKEEKDEDDSEEEVEEVLNLNDEDDVNDDALRERHEKLQEQLTTFLGPYDVEEEIYTSPLDEVDPFVFFAHNLQIFSDQEPQVYQSWASAMDQGMKDEMNVLVAEAEKRKMDEEELKRLKAEKEAKGQ